MNDFELENWLPMEPAKGPPLPRFLNIFWPWYKEEEPPPPVCTVGDWKCVGRNLYICIEWGTINRWKLFERDSNVCYP